MCTRAPPAHELIIMLNELEKVDTALCPNEQISPQLGNGHVVREILEWRRRHRRASDDELTHWRTSDAKDSPVHITRLARSLSTISIKDPRSAYGMLLTVEVCIIQRGRFVSIAEHVRGILVVARWKAASEHGSQCAPGARRASLPAATDKRM